MTRILFVLAALGCLAAAVVALFQGQGAFALSAAGVMVVFFVFAVLADRSGEGLPDTPPPSSP